MVEGRIVLAAALAAGASVALLWGTSLPLGIAGEWTWNRIPVDRQNAAELAWGAISVLAAAGLYLAVAAQGGRRMAHARPTAIIGWLTALAGAGFIWLWAVQEAPPAPHGLSKAPLVLYYPGSSGYFFEARYKSRDVRTFLAHYEARVSQGNDVLHVGTHPPGLFVFFYGLIEFCERVPAATQLILATAPASVTEACAVIERTTATTAHPLLERDRAVLWLAALLMQLAAVLTMFPLFGLLCRNCSARESWMAVSFWSLLPALAIFLPDADALYPLLGVTFLWLWLSGRDQHSPWRCVLAGLVFWLGMFFSLAMLPYALLAALITAWEIRRSADPAQRPGTVNETALLLLCALGGFAAPVLVLAVVFKLNLPAVWAYNYINHAGFYAQYPRTLWKWLLVNPLETTFAVGCPVAVIAAFAVKKTIFRNGTGARRAFGVLFACAVTWGILWLSGKNSGEAARLWIVVFPWLIWLAGDFFSGDHAAQPSESGSLAGASAATSLSTAAKRLQRTWLVLLCLQLLVCLLTVVCVSGFHFDPLAG